MATATSIFVVVQAALAVVYAVLWLIGEPYVFAFGVMGGTAPGISLVTAALVLAAQRRCEPWLRWSLIGSAVGGVIVHAVAWQALASIRWG